MKRLLTLLAVLLLPLAAAGAEPAAAPGFAGAGQVGKMIAGLLLMIVIIIGLAALLKRVNGLQRSLPGAIRVVSVTSIGARERLMLVEVGGRQLLVGAAPGRVQTLLVLDQPVAMPQTAAGRQASGFAERLRDALGAPAKEARS
ncbi:MAG TPA: flagellar biosynthetic protein FliO [Gammaproteobacteria bacterium]|nr:flagellar biosynthetic protein FliO [Gammaproteobacteria bacterium]